MRLALPTIAFLAFANAAHAQIGVTLATRYAQLLPGQALPFTATVTGSANTGVTWQVNNASGGSAATGTITADGVYTAPSTVPTPASVTVTAVSAANPQVSATATMTLLSQAPSGTTYYVAKTGSDNNRGSQAEPFLTIGHAVAIAGAGDTVLVESGVYNEIVAPAHSGSAAAGYLTIGAMPGQAATIDGTGLSVPGGQWGLVTLSGLSFVVVQGFEIRNYSTVSIKDVPVGVFVTGAGSDVQIVNNHIHNIVTAAPTTPSACSSNALGMAVYGNKAPAPISALVVSGNELESLRTGCSESMSIDGNVDGFVVASNLVHHNDNIGIDAIGFERVSPNPSYDQARHGEIRGNMVYDITSYGNPGYGKQYAADGIYVDGGTRITIEQNLVHDVDLGIELASEHKGRLTSYVTARNNVVYGDNSNGISIGGYGPPRGGSDHVTIVNNTLWDNDTRNTGSGELQIQYHATNNVFANNIVYASAQGLLVHNYTASAGTIANTNLYFSPLGAAKSIWRWSNIRYAGFAAYRKGSKQDAQSVFADPLFDSLATLPSLDLMTGSPAIGAGMNLGPAIVGAVDFAGNPRMRNRAITIGAYQQ